MKRTAQELSTSLKGMFGEQTPEGYLELLEDIADSVTDTGDMVTREEYDRVVGERDRYQQDAKDMRDRYINRFYTGYDAPNDKGYIMGEIPQEDIEKEEKATTYADLFE